MKDLQRKRFAARWLALLTVATAAACRARTNSVSQLQERDAEMSTNAIVAKSEADWKASLSPEQYRVLRMKGTERPFSGKYWNLKSDGIYRCAGCGQTLFESKDKFESGCGWPSFSAPAAKAAVGETADATLGMRRTEILCSRCGGHLGHVFEDGPHPTGLRYCINSASLEFQPASQDHAAPAGADKP